MTEIIRRRRRRPHLTDRMIAALERRAAPYFHPDPELGRHGIRVRQEGPGTYTVIIRDIYKKQRWIKIGRTDQMKIAEARDKARSVIRRLEEGLSPFPEPPSKPDSVGDVVETYFKRYVEARSLRTAGEKRRIIETHVLPVWRNRSFAAIGRGDIARLCDAVEDSHGAWVADTVLVELGAISRWYAARTDGYQPPFIAGMKRVSGETRKRSRILSDHELRRVWATAGDAGTYGALIKLLLLSAQRREKVATIKWSDLAPDGTWTIATQKREKNNPGTLLLPEAALAIIKSLPRFTGNPYMFAARRGCGSISHFAQAKRAFDTACGVQDWVLHDLRRTARSLLSRAGVRPDIAERVLGHVRGGVEAVYDRHTYGVEKAEALRKLAALVDRIVAPPAENVVALEHARA
jgi:integrase